MNLGVCLSVSLRFLTRQLPVIWYKMIWKRKYTSHQNFYQIWHHYFGMFLSHQLSIIFQIYIGTSNLHKVINPLHLYFISNYRHIRVWFLLLGSFLHIFFHKVNWTIHASLHKSIFFIQARYIRRKHLLKQMTTSALEWKIKQNGLNVRHNF